MVECQINWTEMQDNLKEWKVFLMSDFEKLLEEFNQKLEKEYENFVASVREKRSGLCYKKCLWNSCNEVY